MDSAEQFFGDIDSVLDEFSELKAKTQETPKQEDPPSVNSIENDISDLFEGSQKMESIEPEIKSQEMNPEIKPEQKIEKKQEEIIKPKSVDKDNKFPLDYISPKDIDSIIYPELKKELKNVLDSEQFKQSVQKAKTKSEKGYDTTGISSYFLMDRLNDVVGPSHWRTNILSVETKESSTGRSYRGIASVILQIGNTFELDSSKSVWKFYPVWESKPNTGTSINMTEGDALKGCVTNAFKKACADIGLGAEAYRGTLDDDLEVFEEQEKQKKKEEQTQIINQQVKLNTGEATIQTKNTKPDVMAQFKPWVSDNPDTEHNRAGLLKTVHNLYHALSLNSTQYLDWVIRKKDELKLVVVPEDETQIAFEPLQKIYNALYETYKKKIESAK